MTSDFSQWLSALMAKTHVDVPAIAQALQMDDAQVYRWLNEGVEPRGQIAFREFLERRFGDLSEVAAVDAPARSPIPAELLDVQERIARVYSTPAWPRFLAVMESLLVNFAEPDTASLEGQRRLLQRPGSA